MKSVRSIVILGLLMSASSMAISAPSDDAAIRQLEATQEAAWNAHDAHAFMQTFAPDADIITAEGHETQGRDVAERGLAVWFSSFFATSQMHVDDVSSRSLSPDYAFVRMAWTLSGLHTPDGSPQDSVHLIQTQLIERSGGVWLITSAQNTAKLPDYHPAAATSQPASATPALPPAPRKPCLLANRSGTCLIEGQAKRSKGG